MNITNNYFSCDIPNLPSTAWRWLHTFFCVKFTYDNVEYKIDDYLEDYPTISYFQINIWQVSGGTLRIIVTPVYYDPNDDTIENGTNIIDSNDALNKSFSVDNAIGYFFGNNDIDSEYENYFTIFATGNPTYNLTNCSVILDVAPFQYSMSVGLQQWKFPHPIVIRANNGYVFNNESFSLLIDGQYALQQFVQLSGDGKELSFTSGEIPSSPEFPLRYPFLSFVFTAVAVATVPLNITNDLSDVVNSNTATSILNGESYSATLSTSAGRYITNVLITMGGVDITNEVYDSENYTINVPSVTGDLWIHAEGLLNPTITNNLTGCTTSNSATTCDYGDSYTATITANTGYSLEDASVLITMDGIEQTGVYNATTGIISIPSVTGDLSITIIAVSIKSLVIKSSDGITTFKTIEFTHIRSLLFTINENTRTLRVDGVNYTWLQLIPEGKIITGLSLEVNSRRYIIPVGIEVNVNYRTSITLYECMIDEVVPTESFSLVLYKQSAELNRVDKTNYLTLVTTLYGTLRDQSNVINPTFTIEYDKVIDFNYIHIPIWNRYYFVREITYGIKNLITLSLKEDVLMSHKEAIYNQSGLVARNEFNFNEQVIDSERIVNNNPEVFIAESHSITNFYEPGEDDKIVINVIGGN